MPRQFAVKHTVYTVTEKDARNKQYLFLSLLYRMTKQNSCCHWHYYCFFHLLKTETWRLSIVSLFYFLFCSVYIKRTSTESECVFALEAENISLSTHKKKKLLSFPIHENGDSSRASKRWGTIKHCHRAMVKAADTFNGEQFDLHNYIVFFFFISLVKCLFLNMIVSYQVALFPTSNRVISFVICII